MVAPRHAFRTSFMDGQPSAAAEIVQYGQRLHQDGVSLPYHCNSLHIEADVQTGLALCAGARPNCPMLAGPLSTLFGSKCKLDGCESRGHPMFRLFLVVGGWSAGGILL
jgi:hypothetical protein